MHEQLQVVVIGLCTCKRPKLLRACLDSLAAQIVPQDCALHIVVIDNDEQPNARAGVESFAAACPFPVHYAHEPMRGIAVARNAVLRKARLLAADWIVMLDDDETAEPNWVAMLMAPEYRQYPVLMGHRIWLYPEPRPFWAPEHEPRLAAEGGKARHYSTSNARFSAALLEAGVRFDESMGLAGGSDQRFFNDAVRHGFAIHATNRAVTYESAHRERLSYRFLIKRHYAHTASVASTRIRERGYASLLKDAPKRLLDIPLGVLELGISPIAGIFGRSRFKYFALRGGRRLAQVAGIVATAAGHNPQVYRQVAGS